MNAEESEYDIYDRQSKSKPRVEWVGERIHVQHAKPESVTPPPYYPDHPVVREDERRGEQRHRNVGRAGEAADHDS